jgi:hypothetical protein
MELTTAELIDVINKSDVETPNIVYGHIKRLNNSVCCPACFVKDQEISTLRKSLNKIVTDELDRQKLMGAVATSEEKVVSIAKDVTDVYREKVQEMKTYLEENDKIQDIGIHRFDNTIAGAYDSVLSILEDSYNRDRLFPA